MLVPDTLVLAAQVRRHADLELVKLVESYLEPWPVVVHVLEGRPDLIRLELGRGTFLDVPIDRSRPRSAYDVALDVARMARARWHVLEPADVPANVTLGQD